MTPQRRKTDHIRNVWDFLRWLIGGKNLFKVTFYLAIVFFIAFSSFSFSVGNSQFKKDSITTIILNLIK
jgi:hypothetical protein